MNLIVEIITQGKKIMNSLVPSNEDFNTLQTLAKVASLSKLYSSVGDANALLMVLLSAWDLGIKPTTALNGGIWCIRGKVEISSRLMNSMIRRAGHQLTIKTINDNECIMEGKRSDTGETMTSSFTIADAKRAGLLSGMGWQKYPQDMLYARSMSRLARRLFPDVIGTAYVEGEIKDSELREAEYEEVEPEKGSTEPPQIEDNPYINDTQVHELMRILSECSPEYQENVKQTFAKLGHGFEKLSRVNYPKWATKILAEREKFINGSSEIMEENT